MVKRILIELDDVVARDLERVAPARDRRRTEFVRLAIRRAIDLALDRVTEQTYRERPLAAEEVTPADLVGWDDHNALAKPAAKAAARKKKPRRRSRAA